MEQWLNNRLRIYPNPITQIYTMKNRNIFILVLPTEKKSVPVFPAYLMSFRRPY